MKCVKLGEGQHGMSERLAALTWTVACEAFAAVDEPKQFL